MNIDESQGWTEIIIEKNCSIDQFHKIAGILYFNLNISYSNKIQDTDSTYWDFIYKNVELTLHYNNYIGISVFLKRMKNATSLENQIVIELSIILFELLEKDYKPY